MSTLSAVSKCFESMKDFSRVNLTHYYRTLKYVSEVHDMKRYHFILLCIHVVLYVCTWCCVKCKATTSLLLKKTLENHVCLHCHLKWHNDTYADLFCSVCIQCSLIKWWPKCKRWLFFFFFFRPYSVLFTALAAFNDLCWATKYVCLTKLFCKKGLVS